MYAGGPHQHQRKQGPLRRLQHTLTCEQHQALLPQLRQDPVSPASCWSTQEQIDYGSA